MSIKVTGKVLQLNKSYEPDRVIDVMHAVCLVEVRKVAHTVETDDTQVVRTSSGLVYKVPSVIVLKSFVDLRRKRRESGKMRFHIFVRDRFRCQYCAKKFAPFELTLDHIEPRSRGGSDEPENLATSCVPCNQRKGSRTPEEARMPLVATPSALRYGLDRAMFRHYAESRPKWRYYLYLEEKVA